MSEKEPIEEEKKLIKKIQKRDDEILSNFMHTICVNNTKGLYIYIYRCIHRFNKKKAKIYSSIS